ncbi:MAG: DUF669 domain-containing protein [Clostridiales Family XIII bacterium]|nr:DUF669 domain-containing protein [Clostridia bacterium]MDY3011737.1 DUF669 domain-containing protein [Clostridiales Family XIII bacterium]
MAVNWEKYDEQIDLKGLQKDVEEAAENSGEYPEIPPGEYEVSLKSLELGKTKENPRAMVKAQFQIVDGEFKNSYIFMNQLVVEGWQIKRMNGFLKSLETTVGIDFESYAQYAQMLLDIAEEIDGKFEYLIEYGQTKKGFPTFTVKEVFELE